MTVLAGLDINSSRLRAVVGTAGSAPAPLRLDAENSDELPLAISLQGRRPEVGRPAWQLCRQLPHLACVNFLPQLGTDRYWTAGRHRLSASAALALVLKKVQPLLADVAELVLAVPAYLSRVLRCQLVELARQAKWPALHTIPAALTAASAARTQRPWHGLALVLDVDDHALCWTALTAAETQARLLAERVEPALGLAAWKQRLLDAIADRCVRHSRRDPRAVGASEQMLYEQLDTAMEACRHGKPAELVIQSQHWYQDLFVRPGEIERSCKVLVRQCVAGLRQLLGAARIEQPPAVIVATAPAARLPGLLRALEQQTDSRFMVLHPNAPAGAAYELAVRWQSGSLPRVPVETSLPLPRAPRPAARTPKVEATGRNTRLPLRKPVPLRADEDDFTDDFSVAIDE